MSMTDPIADLLARIRNALTAKHASLSVPASRMKAEIVKIMRDEGYIDDFGVDDAGPQGTITITLKRTARGVPAISGLERVSSPGRRVYCGKNEIPRVLNGMGITILSTSKGVMTGQSSREHGIGGEVLCNVW